MGLLSRVTAPTAYLLLPHGRNQADWFRADVGVNQRYNYPTVKPEISALAAAAAAMGREADQVYIVTNNHRGKAIVNALQLCRRLIPAYTFGSRIPGQFFKTFHSRPPSNGMMTSMIPLARILCPAALSG